MISEDTTAQPDNLTSGTHTFGNHTKLLDEDDDDAALSQVVETPTISIRRYPAQERLLPPHLQNYIRTSSKRRGVV